MDLSETATTVADIVCRKLDQTPHQDSQVQSRMKKVDFNGRVPRAVLRQYQIGPCFSCVAIHGHMLRSDKISRLQEIESASKRPRIAILNDDRDR
jgi:hypothetical protein